MANPWMKTHIQTDNGNIVEGIAPIILSASRATDIPAFYGKWFSKRLEKGYIRWENRFNPQAPMYISFEKVRLIVFWTKNPEPFIPYLKELDKKNIHYYFQFTLNDYEKEDFEPNLPSLKTRIETFHKLSSLIGKEKVIWRFDPLLKAEELPVKELAKRTGELGDELIPFTNKLVFSFADIFNYRQVKSKLIRNSSRFTTNNINLAEFTDEEKREYAKYLTSYLKKWREINSCFTIATCAEAIDLESYNMLHNKCIDDDLIVKLFPEDKELMSFIGYEPTFTNNSFLVNKKKLKDKNQRLLCGCIYSKDIGSYNTCAHHCIYCYANNSVFSTEANIKRMNPETDSLLPFQSGKSIGE